MKFPCPVCGKELTLYRGDAMNNTNGFTVRCEYALCKADVEAHGDSPQKAYETVVQKFNR